MKKFLLVVAALLLTGLGEAATAFAEEKSEQSPKQARKVMRFLQSTGLDHPQVIFLVNSFDERLDNGYLRITEHEIGEGKLRFGYKAKPRISTKMLELRYTPDDSRYHYTASTREVMVHYQLRF